jgi:hypothetical protein
VDSFYRILDKLKDHLRAGDHTNAVTEGNIDEIDLNKHNIYPLAHILVDDVEIQERTIEFRLKIVVADVVDFSQDDTDDDRFYGNDNLQDVLNTQLQVLNRAFKFLRVGSLRDEGYEASDKVIATPFKERFEMSLAGWTGTFYIKVLNDFSIC